MASVNVFEADQFSLTSLSTAVDKMDYKPSLLGSLGIFNPKPVTTRTVWVDSRDGGMNLIQTSADGSPPEELVKDSRTARAFKAVRLAKGATIKASEIAGWRAFGTESEQERVMSEYARRMTAVRNDMELTHEKHRLGAIQGKLLDADGTEIYDYFTEFGESDVAAVNFALSTAATIVRNKCNEIVRGMMVSSKGRMGAGSSVHALVGHTFYDLLTNHTNVKESFINWQAAQDLRQGNAYQAFTFGGITFHDYRGTDDGSDIAVAAKEAKFFPVGTDLFDHIMAPADEFMPYVGAPGQNIYSMNLVDRDRQSWVRNEQYSYPLFMCNQPGVLRKATTP